MTKRKGYECDICGGHITFRDKFRAQLRRPFLLRHFQRGGRDDDVGWAQKRYDLCDECWEEVLETVKAKVTGE